MLKRFHFTTGALLVSSFLVLGALAGCGSSDSPDQGSETETTKSTNTTSGTTAPEQGTKEPGDKKSGNKETSGSGPASAHDKHGKAPDDVISERPGGPKPPGAPQPVK